MEYDSRNSFAVDSGTERSKDMITLAQALRNSFSADSMTMP